MDKEEIPAHSVRQLLICRYSIRKLTCSTFSPRARSVGAINDDWRIDILVLVTP